MYGIVRTECWSSGEDIVFELRAPVRECAGAAIPDMDVARHPVLRRRYGNAIGPCELSRRGV